MGFWDDLQEGLNFVPGVRTGRAIFNTGREILRPRFFDNQPDRAVRSKRNIPQANIYEQQPPVAPGGSLGPLYEMLLEMLTQPVGVNEAGLMSQVQSQLDPIFNQRIQQAEATAGRGREDITGSYRALAQDYERLAPEQAAQAQQAQAEVEDLYGTLASNIQGHYSRIAEEQGDLFKQLGIEEAAPAVLNPQAERAASATQAAEELGASQQQRYQDIANIDETYFREGAPLATLTGSNRVSDLMFQLQNFVQQTEAERSAQIAQSYNQLLGQAQAQAAQQQSQQQGMLWDILQAQLEASQPKPGEMTDFDFRMMLPQEAQSALRSIEKSTEAVEGRQQLTQHPVPGTFTDLTPEWWLNAVDQMHSRGQISDQTRQILFQYLLMTQGS